MLSLLQPRNTRFGVDHPEFGVLFDDMDVSDMAEVPSGRLLQPMVEAEIAFILGADLDADRLDVQTVRAAVDHAVAAFEIADSRVARWDVTVTDVVADNASAGLYLLGRSRLALTEFEPREVTMRMDVDGDPVAQGDGTACLGDPLKALMWLARTARDLGEPLRAGHVVLSGALAPMVPAAPGATIRAEMSALGSITATFLAATTCGLRQAEASRRPIVPLARLPPGRVYSGGRRNAWTTTRAASFAEPLAASRMWASRA